MAPGANYMGGKRSAARARSKDTTGRAHKSFFGRQRLEILSNGLSGVSRRTSRGHGPQASAADIGLAHAPRHAEPEEHVSYTTLTNVSVPPRTPHAESRRSAAGSCSETRGRRSKVIEALDENDPLSRRLALDRILSIPDLAGLSSRSIKNVIPPRNTVKRRRSPQHSPRSQGERGKRQKHRQSFTGSPSYYSPTGDQNIQNTERMDKDYNTGDEGYDDVYGRASSVNDVHQTESSSHSTRSSLSSSLHFNYNEKEHFQEENDTDDRRVRVSLPPARSFLLPSFSLSSRPAPHILPLHDDPDDAENSLNFPIRDNLYDYPNPWNAVGVFLGLEDIDEARQWNNKESISNHEEPIVGELDPGTPEEAAFSPIGTPEDDDDEDEDETCSIHSWDFYGASSRSSTSRYRSSEHQQLSALDSPDRITDCPVLHSPAKSTSESQCGQTDIDAHSAPATLNHDFLPKKNFPSSSYAPASPMPIANIPAQLISDHGLGKKFAFGTTEKSLQPPLASDPLNDFLALESLAEVPEPEPPLPVILDANLSPSARPLFLSSNDRQNAQSLPSSALDQGVDSPADFIENCSRTHEPHSLPSDACNNGAPYSPPHVRASPNRDIPELPLPEAPPLVMPPAETPIISCLQIDSVEGGNDRAALEVGEPREPLFFGDMCLFADDAPDSDD